MGIFILLSNISSFGQENDKTVKDIDGNVYKTVIIGTQEWMAENLKTTRFRNGDLIGTTNPSTLVIANDEEQRFQWAYDGDESNVAIYGRLYTWYAATDSRNVCPNGWHLPTSAEWTTMTKYLLGWKVAGGLLKEAGTEHWGSPNRGATNCSGFTALPGGCRLYFKFRDLGVLGYWWYSGDIYGDRAFHMTLNLSDGETESYTSAKITGLSVRCLRDN